MCGIAGIWGNAEQARVEKISARLHHRGPDQKGTWAPAGTGPTLIHCRLAIIDIDGGKQPMTSISGRTTVVFNGAIYNYPELRESLGHDAFRTASDTETILVAYERFGMDFLDHLHGMYALGLWDHTNQTLILARDQSGKKPLYCTVSSDEFIFASETCALRSALRDSPSVDEKALRDYLTWGCVPGPRTIYAGIECLRPGEVVVVRERRIVERFVRSRSGQVDATTVTAGMDRDGLIDSVERQLSQAVQLRLRADVPVGCFLSGGIDSGLITAIAARHSPQPMKTLTVGFEDGGFDERQLAAGVARKYGTDHAEIVVSPRPAEDLPRITRAYDQPFADSSAIPSFYVAEAARKHVKVVLNGDGGDELFGGYRRHNAARIRDLIPFSNARVPRMLFRFVRRVAPVPSGFRTGYAFLHRLVRGLGEVDVDCYRDWTLNGYTSSELRRLGWAPCATADASVEEILRGHGVEFGAVSTFLTSVLTADAAGVLPYDLLVKMDIACMSVGLEGRSPFMDEQLWTLANSIPVTRRAGLLTTKPLLRRLAERHLPGEIQTAPKRGFEVPLAAWLASELKPMCHDIVLAGNGLLAQLFRRQELEALLSGRWPLDPGRWARRVWILFMLGMWDRECRDSPAG